jgi:hypothetical protein
MALLVFYGWKKAAERKVILRVLRKLLLFYSLSPGNLPSLRSTISVLSINY